MKSGTIWKQLVSFSVPLLVGNILQQLYSTVDSVVVGNFIGSSALGAISSVSSAINTLIGFFSGLSTGASVIISQHFGAGDVVSMRKTIHASLMLSIIIGVLLTGVGIISTPVLLNLMATPSEVYPEAFIYMQIYFSGIIGLTLFNMGSAILRAVGDSQHPLQFLMISTSINIILDLLFVVVLKKGVAGVAIATIIAQFVSDIFIAKLLFSTEEHFRISIREMKMDFKTFKQIFHIGIPAGLQMSITSFSNVFVQSYINYYGASCTAGWGAYNRLDSFLSLPRGSIGTAIATFVGQNKGARNKERIQKGIKNALLLSILSNVFITIILFIFAKQAVSLFNQEPEVLRYGVLFIRILTPLSFLCCINHIQAAALRGTGDSCTPMLIMVGSFVVFRQIYLFIISRFTDSIYLIAFCYPAAWIVCTVLMGIYFKHSKWEDKIE